jgi:hypothetical protein
MTRKQLRARAGGLVVVTTLGITFACSFDATPPKPPVVPVQLSIAQAAKVTAARERMAWAGHLHSEAMRDLMAHRREWLGGPKTRANVCRAALRLTMKYAVLIDSQAGLTRSDDERQSFVRGVVESNPKCATVTTMSLFGVASSVLAPVAGMSTQGGEAIGDFLPYVEAMSRGVEASSGQPPEVFAVTTAVLSSAAWIPAPDLEVVAGTKSFADSSSVEWTAFGQGGGFSDECLSGCTLMSLFGRDVYSMVGWWDNVKRVVGADVVGCWTGTLDAWYAGVREPRQIAAACVIWGVGSSATMALSLM